MEKRIQEEHKNINQTKTHEKKSNLFNRKSEASNHNCGEEQQKREESEERSPRDIERHLDQMWEENCNCFLFLQCRGELYQNSQFQTNKKSLEKY